MIKVEGYKAFGGTMRISPKNGAEPFELEGEWLYKPDTKCWYGTGRSFPEDICEVVSDADEKRIPKKAIYDGKFYSCSACSDEMLILHGDNFCSNCGQALDWNGDGKGDEKE